MPLSNDEKKMWDGWLIDGIAGRIDEYEKALIDALKAKNLPKCEIYYGTNNMWFRKDSHYIDVESTLDGEVVCTIHLQDYGISLWVGRAVESHFFRSNYYKRMAVSAFITTIDRCIHEATLKLVDATAFHEVEDVGKKSD